MCSISHTKHLMVLHTAFFILGWHEMKQYLYDEMGWCKLCAFGHFVRVTWTQVLWAWQLLSYSWVGNAYSVDTLNKRMAHGVWQREIPSGCSEAHAVWDLSAELSVWRLWLTTAPWNKSETTDQADLFCVSRAMKKGLEGLRGKLAYKQVTFYLSALPISPQCFMAYLVKIVFVKWILDWLCSLSSESSPTEVMHLIQIRLVSVLPAAVINCKGNPSLKGREGF